MPLLRKPRMGSRPQIQRLELPWRQSKNEEYTILLNSLINKILSLDISLGDETIKALPEFKILVQFLDRFKIYGRNLKLDDIVFKLCETIIILYSDRTKT